ncbi:hypothetical protein [Flindersiella endophytica]
MSLAISVPFVIALGALIFILHKFAGLKWWHAAVCALFGFYVATTAFAPTVTNLVSGLVRLLSGS